MVLIFFVLWCTTTSAQEMYTETIIGFRVNSTQIESGYKDNASRISELVSFLKQVQADSTVNIERVSFSSAASPEGNYEYNRKLARGRLSSIEKLVRNIIDIPDCIITRDDEYIQWDHLISMIDTTDITCKDEVLSILHEEPVIVDYFSNSSIDRRILKLMKLDGGKVWKDMLHRFFDSMRNACVVFVTFKQLPPPPVVVSEPVIEEVEAISDTVATIEPVGIILDTIPTPVAADWERKLSVKTNALGWGMGISNAAVEIDLCRHLSFNLPVYYSAWNYFTPTVKFRALAIQPEIRYWFSEEDLCYDGWFMGAHFGLAWYNIATDGEYRIQDHDGKSPALGGGLAVGYRMPISKNNRWKMEFSIGAGAYSLHYNKFRNQPNGLLVNTEKKTYIGIDQASVSFSYTFDLKRKGGTR